MSRERASLFLQYPVLLSIKKRTARFLFWISSEKVHLILSITAWKVSIFGVILVRIFPHLDWIGRDTPYLSVLSPNAEKYGPEKLRIRTRFTQWIFCRIEGTTLRKMALLNTEFWVFFRIIKVTISHVLYRTVTAQKMKFLIKDFFSKCDQIPSKLRIWSHLLEKSLMENFIFCVVPGVCLEHWKTSVM